MPPGRFGRELARVGRMITGWRAELTFALCASVVLVVLWAFSLSDIYLQYARIGRIVVWLVLVGLIGLTISRVMKVLAQKHSVMGIAARVELAFPELDNHLINFLQFSDDKTNNPFKQEYVKRGCPEFSKLKFKDMKNRKAHGRVNISLAVAFMLMLAPTAFDGKAWAVAVWRMVNPFSNVQPISLTHILSVEPGDATALVGSPLVLNCKVSGKSGHKIHLDIKPADDERTVYSIGTIQGDPEEEFSYRIAKLTTDMKYRFRAGDSPAPSWYTIKARPPLAMTSIDLTVKPPEYTRTRTRTFEGMSDEVFIPQGSEVTMKVKCNAGMRSATVAYGGKKPVALTKTSSDDIWTGRITVDAGSVLKFEAVDTYDAELVNVINYTLVVDKPPIIDILAPKGRSILPPGTAPNIEFAIIDDYGLVDVKVERVAAGSTKRSKGKAIATWQANNAKDFVKTWDGKDATSTGTMAFRITATDNCPFSKQTGKSVSVVFNAINMAKAEKIKEALNKKADVALSRVIRLQQDNIEKTKIYEQTLELTNADMWQELTKTQTSIRTLTKTILTNPLNPLGNLAASVKKVYMNEMAFAITELGRIANANATEKPLLVSSTLATEEKVLRYLTFAHKTSDQVKADKNSSMLSDLLSAIIKGESDVIKKTKSFMQKKAEIGETLIDKQDDLASDLAEFIKACAEQAGFVRDNDPELAGEYDKAVESCKSAKIRADMMMAAEQLDENKAEAALGHEKSALAKLQAIDESLGSMKAAAESEKMEEMQEVLEIVQAKISKIRKLHAKAQETMEIIKANKNLDTKDIDLMEDEYEELIKKSKEAMLKVPTDLHIFTELNCANDIVEDVISIFQECEQVADSEDILKDDDYEEEEAYAKKDSLDMLKDLEKAEDRIDDLEMWLGEKPDTVKVTVEAMDQEEMPDEGVALGALETSTEDIISDLLEESKDEEDLDKANDGAVNRAMSDVEMGNEVMEGDITTFAAKGKSGNETPDHKEQDGRSNVGRQGMANGETAAGSGTIGEGDKNIEQRRTQDPTQSGQVDVEGEADTMASGGGKQGTGRADGVGDGTGGSQRMDSTMSGGEDGMKAMMTDVERMYDQASMKNIRAPSLKLAAHHIRQAADAIAEARPIGEVNKIKQQAVAALRKAKTELAAGTSSTLDTGKGLSMLDGVVAGGADEAPPQYRDLVNRYYKALNDAI